MPLIAAALLLAITLAAAVRPVGRVPDWAIAVAAAAAAVLAGLTSVDRAGSAMSALEPTLLLLVALFWLAEGCRASGLFDAAATRMVRIGRPGPRPLLAATFALAALTTVVLSLDATVLLVTPVVVRAMRELGARERGPLYACGHLANSASLLLPISNLTNLLAFHASGLGFLHFAALMALPWAAALAVEWVVLSRAGAAGAARRPAEASAASAAEAPRPWPRVPLAILAVTLVGLGCSTLLGLEPWVVGLAGAAAMTALTRPQPRALGRATQPGFVLYVLALAVTVEAVAGQGLSDVIDGALPTGTSWASLLGATAVAALVANLVNNLPATLLLLPVAAAAGTPTLLAVLIGVGIGPNLTFTGSLATLLWRRRLAADGIDVPLGEFTRLGLLTVPAALVASTTALWVVVAVT